MPKLKPQYPEHEKLSAVQSQSQPQGDFLEWLDDNGYAVCRHNQAVGQWIPISESFQKLLAKMHGIDLDAIEKEKLAMLEEFRKSQA